MEYEIHEVANLFPMMSDDEFDSLVKDIEKNGQLDPIWTRDNKIIDGRNRYKACKQLGIEPIVHEWKGIGSLVDFVVSKNLNRRHLTNAQKAAIATDMLPLLEKEAKDRLKTSTGGTKPRPSQKIDYPDKGRATDKAAKIVGTNRQYVSDAKKIKKDSPDVFEKMKTGEINMGKAKRFASMPTETRDKVFEKLPQEEKDKTKVCFECGELLSIEKFDLKSGSSICFPCKYKKDKARKEKIKENIPDKTLETNSKPEIKKQPKQYNEQPPKLSKEEIDRQMLDANVETLFRHLDELAGFVDRTDNIKQVFDKAIERDSATFYDLVKHLEETLNLIKSEVM